MVANVAVTEFTTSAVAVFLLQKMKSAKWFPFLEAGKAWASRIASVILAGVGAIGINYVWTTHQGTAGIFIAWPGWIAIGIALWHWINHYAMQETIYQATANKVMVSSVNTAAMKEPTTK